MKLWHCVGKRLEVQAKETDLVQEKKERTFNDIVIKFKEHINTGRVGSRKGMTEDELN